MPRVFDSSYYKYRQVEYRWTEGACKRGVRRDPYVMVKLKDDRVAFARGSDINNACVQDQVRQRAELKTFALEEVVKPDSRSALNMQRYHNWIVAEVREVDIAPQHRAIEQPLETLPATDIFNAITVMSDISSGHYLEEVLKMAKGLTVEDLSHVAVIPGAYAVHASQDHSWAYQGHYRLQTITPPASLSDLLTLMRSNIYVNVQVLSRPSCQIELQELLTKLRRLYFKAQSIVDRTKREMNFQFPRLTVSAKIETNNPYIRSLYIEQLEDKDWDKLYLVMKPEDL